MFRLSILLMIVIFYLVFTLYNQETHVSLKYPLDSTSQPIPLHLIILGAILTGAVLTGLLLIPAWFRARHRLRQAQRRLRELEDRPGYTAGPGPKSGQDAATGEAPRFIEPPS